MKLFLLKNYKFSFLLIIIFFCFQNISGQEPESNFWSHMRYGGGFGLNFGDGFFSATIAPSAIYEFDENFSLGVGLNTTINNLSNVYKSTILGGSIIGLYNVIPAFQLSSEFEQLHVNRRYNTSLNIPKDKYWIPALYLGAGYRSQNVTFGLRYDVLYNDRKSIYANAWAPFVRVFF